MEGDAVNLILPVEKLSPQDRPRVGNKNWCLGRMNLAGLHVPPAVAIPVDAYHAYVENTGLRETILMELARRPESSMRWEEMWDASLRIRNRFVRTPMPEDLRRDLAPGLRDTFGDRPVVVRSSAPEEDADATSFAGLHESYVNVRGEDAVLKHVRLVWASLWSDAAILYRRELGLDAGSSAMAVVVQELVSGEVSGVVFGRDPTDPSRTAVEAVHGLNQGLVDGSVEPDHWDLDAQTGAVLSHRPAERAQRIMPSGSGVKAEPLPAALAAQPPLTEHQLKEVTGLARRAAELFGGPQDVEWTLAGGRLYVLQSRDITTSSSKDEKGKSWYLTLRRSYENLLDLRRQVEDVWLPGMQRDADAMAAIPLTGMEDADLAAECEARLATYGKWKKVYWDDCIPLAHGMRLFGQLYNDTIAPEDPHEFVNLLSGNALEGLRRNRLVVSLTERWQADPALLAAVKEGGAEALDADSRKELERFLREFGGAVFGSGPQALESVVRFLCALSEHGEALHKPREARAAELRNRFLERFEGEQLELARGILDLAEASYRLRDDDNVYLGRVEAQRDRAVDRGREVLREQGRSHVEAWTPKDVIRGLRDPGYKPAPAAEQNAPEEPEADLAALQLMGQPAGPGVATGSARVVTDEKKVFDVQAGEILVCDAISPAMTVVVPLVAGIVERRGGMLIHGAIIAREYGLPCVTGVDRATERVNTGTRVTVDGYLGIVRIGTP